MPAPTQFIRGDGLFREEKEFITHRITDLYYDGHFYYRTQGDANERPDQNLSHQAVVGRVVFATGTIDFVKCFLRSRLFFLTFIILPRPVGDKIPAEKN